MCDGCLCGHFTGGVSAQHEKSECRGAYYWDMLRYKDENGNIMYKDYAWGYCYHCDMPDRFYIYDVPGFMRCVSCTPR